VRIPAVLSWLVKAGMGGAVRIRTIVPLKPQQSARGGPSGAEIARMTGPVTTCAFRQPPLDLGRQHKRLARLMRPLNESKRSMSDGDRLPFHCAMSVISLRESEPLRWFPSPYQPSELLSGAP